MYQLTLLHLGDIHYPDAITRRSVDHKDHAFPPHLTALTTASPLQSVMRDILSRSLDNCTAILITGDLTSAGNVLAYQECLKYLNANLRLADRDPTTIHVVPGNHDVNRELTSDDPDLLYSKFEPYSKAWKDLGIPILTVDGVRSTELSADKCAATILSANSSVGCGEKRHLPEAIQHELRQLLEDYVVTVGLEKAFNIVGEVLDTPAFIERDIDGISARLASLPSKTFPIILSHHNILPQPKPRLAIYSEVINGGVVRSRLTRQDRAVIYCHGHTHVDTFEIVSQPDFPLSKLISISAPELSTGYNIISIAYSTKHYPIGCRLTRARLNPNDGGIEHNETSVPFFRSDSHYLNTMASPQLGQVLSHLSPGEELRLPQLRDALNNETASTSLTRPALASLLKEAELMGYITLNNHQFSYDDWIVRKAIQ